LSLRSSSEVGLCATMSPSRSATAPSRPILLPRRLSRWIHTRPEEIDLARRLAPFSVMALYPMDMLGIMTVICLRGETAGLATGLGVYET